jgi:septum formation protein
MSKPLILASKSASRSALLKAAGIAFQTRTSGVDEDAIKDDLLARGHNPKSVALHLAEAKATAVAHDHSGIIIGADQVLQLDNELISKSPTIEAAKDLFRRLSGRSHYLHAGLCLAEGQTRLWSSVETVEMQVRPLSEAFIEAYFEATGPEVLGSVGAYHFEGRGAQIFERVSGDYFTVLGLPLLPLLAQLRLYGALS